MQRTAKTSSKNTTAHVSRNHGEPISSSTQGSLAKSSSCSEEDACQASIPATYCPVHLRAQRTETYATRGLMSLFGSSVVCLYPHVVRSLRLHNQHALKDLSARMVLKHAAKFQVSRPG